jgi:predicted permease
MIRRLLRIPTARGTARQVDDELHFHLAARAEDLLRRGECASRDEAYGRAEREFGDVNAARRELRAIDERVARREARTEWWSDIAQDARYALRALRRQPGFALVVLATLALGIGANTAIFTLMNAVQLRPLPVPRPNELVALGNPAAESWSFHSSDVDANIFTYAVYRELRQRNQLVSGLLASGAAGRVDMRMPGREGALEHPHARYVSGNYFTVLEVGASPGRTFDGSEDESVGAAPVVVISHGYWLRRFAGDPHIVGRAVMLNDVRFTIIGVARAGFQGEIVGQALDLWIPISMQPAMMPRSPLLNARQQYWLLLLGRLRPGVSLPRAQAGFATLVRQVLAEQVALDPAHTKFPGKLELFIESGARGFSRLRGRYAAPLFTLMAGVSLLLLIVCANAGNLLLARALARRREMAVRLAIGASGGRLVRQMLTESTVLAVLAGGSGLLLATWGSRLLLALTSGGAGAIPLDLRIDWRVLSFTVALSLFAVVLFGLVPALRAARVDAAPVLRAQGRGSAWEGKDRQSARVPLGRALIIGQVALSLVLVVGALLLARTLRGIERVDPGLDRDHLLIVDVDDQSRGYTGERHLALVRALNEHFAHLPGMAAVSYSLMGLFTGSAGTTTIQVPGFVARTPDDSTIYYDEIGPGYARAIGARLLQGRDIGSSDAEQQAPVMLINETAAHFYFGNTPAVGRTAVFTDSGLKPFSVEIVGVVADVKDRALTGAPERKFYLPYMQHPGDAPPAQVRFELRATGDPAGSIAAVRRAVADVDQQLPIDDVYTLTSRMRQSIAEERLLAQVAGAFGTLALLLASIGLYGVMAYAVNRRTGEFGLRIALGSGPTGIVSLVLRDAFSMVAAGLVLGVLGVFLETRLIGRLLHGVTGLDLTSMGLALSVLAATAAVAALIPALRAGRVTPIVALQQE